MGDPKLHWLCRLGWHLWEFHTSMEKQRILHLYALGDIELDDAGRLCRERRCTRPNCPRWEWESL